MYPVSHVKCHMSHVTLKKIQRGEVSLLKVCYQWGLPRLAFRLFLLKTRHCASKPLQIPIDGAA